MSLNPCNPQFFPETLTTVVVYTTRTADHSDRTFLLTILAFMSKPLSKIHLPPTLFDVTASFLHIFIFFLGLLGHFGAQFPHFGPSPSLQNQFAEFGDGLFAIARLGSVFLRTQNEFVLFVDAVALLLFQSLHDFFGYPLIESGVVDEFEFDLYL